MRPPPVYLRPGHRDTPPTHRATKPTQRCTLRPPDDGCVRGVRCSAVLRPRGAPMLLSSCTLSKDDEDGVRGARGLRGGWTTNKPANSASGVNDVDYHHIVFVRRTAVELARGETPPPPHMPHPRYPTVRYYEKAGEEALREL